jgi:alkylated DNA repair dioxygenase AlkB
MAEVVCVRDSDTHTDSLFVQIPNFLSPSELAYYSAQLDETKEWRSGDFAVEKIPRLQKWFHDELRYFSPHWANQEHERWKSSSADEWLLQLRTRVQVAIDTLFDTQIGPGEYKECNKPNINSTLINYYRNGNDYIRYHKDDEKLFGTNPTIAMLTFGCPRELKFKWTMTQKDRSEPGFMTSTHINDKCFKVEPGTLFIMAGAVQTCYWHGIERDPSIVEPRYSLTFREHKAYNTETV